MRTNVDDRNWKRDSYNGFGNGLAKAFEIALVPAIFGAAGYGLDRLFGVVPVLTIIFAVLAICGMFTVSYYTYKYQMEQAQIGTPWDVSRARVTNTNTDSPVTRSS